MSVLNGGVSEIAKCPQGGFDFNVDYVIICYSGIPQDRSVLGQLHQVTIEEHMELLSSMMLLIR